MSAAIGNGAPSMAQNVHPIGTRWLHDAQTGKIAKVENLVINNDNTMSDGSTWLIPPDHPWAKNKSASSAEFQSKGITLVAVVKDFYQIRTDLQQQRKKVLDEVSGNVEKKASAVASLLNSNPPQEKKASLQQQQLSLQHLESGLKKMTLGSEMIAQADAELQASKQRSDAAFERLAARRKERLAAAKAGQTTAATVTTAAH